MTTGKRTQYLWQSRSEAYSVLLGEGSPPWAGSSPVAAVLVLVLGVRRLGRGRRSPEFDQSRLEEADYRRIGQDTHNIDVRYGPQ